MDTSLAGFQKLMQTYGSIPRSRETVPGSRESIIVTGWATPQQPGTTSPGQPPEVQQRVPNKQVYVASEVKELISANQRLQEMLLAYSTRLKEMDIEVAKLLLRITVAFIGILIFVSLFVAHLP